MKTEFNDALQRFVALAKDSSGLSQQALADAAGINRNWVNRAQFEERPFGFPALVLMMDHVGIDDDFRRELIQSFGIDCLRRSRDADIATPFIDAVLSLPEKQKQRALRNLEKAVLRRQK